jgi:uncharacterized protein
MDRNEVLALVKEHVKGRNLVSHMLAVEAVMGALARHFGEEETTWRLAGLVHDLDYDETLKSPERHGLVSGKILEERGFPPDVIQAVKAHNPALGAPRESQMDKALYCSDPVTGLVVASALIHPDKKLASIDAGFVHKRFHEKHFAKGADRDQIRACSELGLELEEFLDMAVRAMQEIAPDLGL